MEAQISPGEKRLGQATASLSRRAATLWTWIARRRAAGTGSLHRVAAFETRLNQDPCAVADRLWVKDHLNPDEEKLRFSR